MERKNDEFDRLMEEIQGNEPFKEKYLGINNELGVGFDVYFHITALCWLNSGNPMPISFPLCSADSFKDLKSQEEYFDVGKNSKSFEFTKSNGDRYLISIFLKEDSMVGKLHDYEFVKTLFWMIDPRFDVKEVCVNESILDRCLFHYLPSGENWEESVYVVVRKLQDP